jgi:hypothetical protein
LSELASWKLVILAAISVMVLFSVDTYVIPAMTAHAQVSQKTVCVLQPIDLSINSKVVNMTEKVLVQHKETFSYIGLVQELTDKSNTGCNYVIQFQRAVNSNYNWMDKTVHYTISGNTLTLYTNRTPVNIPSSIAGGGIGISSSGAAYSKGGDIISPVMTNPVCLAEALGTFHQNANGFSGYEICNPYSGTQTVSDNMPFYVIHKSLEHALTKMHL